MSFKKNTALIYFVVPYILILIFALIIGVIVYQKTLNVVETEVKNGTLGILDQTRDIVNMKLEEVETLAIQLKENPRVLDFKNIVEPFKGNNTYKVIDTQDALDDYILSNQFIFNYFFLFKNSNIVMNDRYVDTIPNFYKYSLNTNIEYENWYKGIVGEFHQKKYLPAREYTYKGKTYSFITYVDSLGYPFYYQGALMVLIDNKQIQQLLQGIDISDGGWAYVADGDGNIISYISSEDNKKPTFIDIKNEKGLIEQKIESKNMMVTYTRSSMNGWTYVAVQPTNIVMEKVNYINKITISIVLGSLLLGLLISFYLGYRNAKPIRKLFQNNEELQQKVKEQIPILRSSLFERVFKGEINTKEEIEIMMHHIGMNIKGNYYLVFILYLPKQGEAVSEESLKKLDVQRVITKDLLHQVFGDLGHIHDVNEDKIAVLLRSHSTNQQEFRDHVKQSIIKMTTELHNVHQINSILTIGTVYEDLMDISRSYEEAIQALNYKIINSHNEVIWYDELSKESNSYYYPHDVEVRLTNLVKAGEEDRVVQLLNELYTINFVERNQSLYMLRFLLSEMWGSLVKLIDQVVIDDEKTYEVVEAFSFEVESMEEIQTSYHNLINTYKRICSTVSQQKKSSNTQLCHNIIEYMKRNYMKPDMSLTSISDEFEITEAYLSRFFKEHTALNVSEYIEKLRMDQAERLLISTDLPVGEVGMNVGYTSINTFGRAFKRKNGVSPSAFRNSMKVKKSV